MLQGSRCRFGVTAPGIDHPCVAEMRFQFSRMHYAELANGLENLLLQLRHASDIPRMQKLPGRAGKKTVRVENVLFNIQRSVIPVEIAHAIRTNPVSQYQVLRPGRGPDRIRLHKSKPPDGSFQCGLWEKGLRDCKCAQTLETGHGHT